LANPVVNIPPTGPANTGQYGTAAGPQNPYQNAPGNIGAYINAKAHGAVKAWGFGQLATVPMVVDGVLGAGLTGSAVSGSIILPQYCKIPKVAIGFATADLFNGTETLNIVVESAGDYNPAIIAGTGYPNAAMANGSPLGAGKGYGVTYTPGIAQTTGPGDNSGWAGYPAQYAAPGTCLFGTDIGIGPVFFTSPSAGTTAGGAQVFPTTEWDTVYCPGTILSLRAVTTASTGDITGLVVTLLIQVLDKYIGNPTRPIPCLTW
jgi:hypothetical protein